jgi:hypothetical protein
MIFSVNSFLFSKETYSQNLYFDLNWKLPIIERYDEEIKLPSLGITFQSGVLDKLSLTYKMLTSLTLKTYLKFDFSENFNLVTGLTLPVVFGDDPITELLEEPFSFKPKLSIKPTLMFTIAPKIYMMIINATLDGILKIGEGGLEDFTLRATPLLYNLFIIKPANMSIGVGVMPRFEYRMMSGIFVCDIKIPVLMTIKIVPDIFSLKIMAVPDIVIMDVYGDSYFMIFTKIKAEIYPLPDTLKISVDIYFNLEGYDDGIAIYVDPYFGFNIGIRFYLLNENWL